MTVRIRSYLIEMPYEPLISVNRIHFRGRQNMAKRPEAVKWLDDLEGKIRDSIANDNPKGVTDVRLDMWIEVPHKGTMPDTSNFRKAPQDVIAKVLGVDDHIFGGEDNPARVSTRGAITFELTLWWSVRGDVDELSESSKHHFGPLDDKMARLFYGKDVRKLCSGFGSVYCVAKCDQECLLDWEYSPRVFSDTPCLECTSPECRCINKDTKLEADVEKWWEARCGKA